MKIHKNIFIILLLAILSACSKVPAGHVGVKVYLLGTSKGVDTEELPVGRYWIGVNEDLFLFPTFTQNYTWTKSEDPGQGSPTNESMSFQTIEGLSVSADVGISYRIDPTKVTEVFQKYRRGVDEITDVFLRNMVRDSLVSLASEMDIESVYGSGKTALMESVQEKVSSQVLEIGIIIEKLYWIGDLRLPPTVVKSINQKIEATQMAQRRRNEVEQSKAEADKLIESARGESESMLLRARAEAESIALQGEALRANPEVLQLRSIEKWDGVLPRVNGEAIPFINVNPDQ